MSALLPAAFAIIRSFDAGTATARRESGGDGTRGGIACYDRSRRLTHAENERHPSAIRDAFFRMEAERPRGRRRR